MGHRFQEIAFTDTVKSVQEQLGSRRGYSRREGGDFDFNNALGPREAAFIANRDSFYMASVSETGWPYVQHRGGPAGFVRVLDERTIGFADFSGNLHYVSVGNLITDDRVSKYQRLDGRLQKTSFDPTVPYFLDEEDAVHEVTGPDAEAEEREVGDHPPRDPAQISANRDSD